MLKKTMFWAALVTTLLAIGVPAESYAAKYVCGRVKNGTIGVNVRKVTVKAPNAQAAASKAKKKFKKQGFKVPKNIGCVPL